MDMKVIAPVLIALSVFFAVENVSYAVLGRPLLSFIGLGELNITMTLHFFFNLAFAVFVWQVSRRQNP